MPGVVMQVGIDNWVTYNYDVLGSNHVGTKPRSDRGSASAACLPNQPSLGDIVIPR